MPNRPDNKEPSDSSWIQYQQLVLNNLQRHEDKLNILEEEIINSRVVTTRLEMEIKSNTNELSKILEELKSIEKKFTEKILALDAAREKLNGEISSVKWKITAATTVFATALTAVLQGVVKFFIAN